MSAAANESILIFDSSLYRQIDGLAMGSPLDPILEKTIAVS